MTALALLCLIGVSFVASDSCVNRCFTSANSNYDCQCNESCIQYGDCCYDYNLECDEAATCVGKNCDTYYSSEPCQCNDQCVSFQNCCPDRQEVCSGVSCRGRCGLLFDSTYTCQCNSDCSNFGDCCADYSSVCQGNNGDCTPISVTDSEIKDISWTLWQSDTNSFPYNAITYNLQSKTSTSATDDVAPQPFFTNVDEWHFGGETYQKLKALQDNYERRQGLTEDVTQGELDEDEAFLDAVLGTAVGQTLYGFLDSKNLAGCAGINGLKTILKDIWFGMYDRKAPDDTSGFEHSFVGEIKGDGVSGFHNWMYFYEQEKLGYFNYQGYINDKEPRMVAVRHTWHDATKPMNGFTIGTSPEIEFALYTLCFLTKPGSKCDIYMGDQYGVKVSRSIQTYTWANETPPNADYYIASAYFIS